MKEASNFFMRGYLAAILSAMPALLVLRSLDAMMVVVSIIVAGGFAGVVLLGLSTD